MRFLNGSEDPKDIRESTISDDPIVAIKEFLSFVRDRLPTIGRNLGDAGSTR